MSNRFSACVVLALLLGSGVLSTAYAQSLGTITNLNPPSAPIGSGAITLFVSGTNFTQTSVVRFNGSDRPTTFGSSTFLRATIPASDLTMVAPATITVFNSAGLSNSAVFSVHRRHSINASDIVYDRNSGKIYASVSGDAALSPNTITTLDPFTGATGASGFIGSAPGQLALSDDGTYLYAALQGAAAVGRMPVASMTRDLQFSLDSDSGGPYYADDLKVLPGSPTSIAVSRRGPSPYTASHKGIAIYDNGVPRALQTGNDGYNVRVEFSDTASTLYAYTINNSSSEFRTLSVTPAGVAVTSSTQNLTSFRDYLRFCGGLVYSSSGAVINPQTQMTAGQFVIPQNLFATALVCDAAQNRVFFVSPTGGSLLWIDIFDRTTYAFVGRFGVAKPGTGSASETATNLVRWGDDGLALLNAAGEVVVFRVPQEFLGSSVSLSSSLAGLSFDDQPVGTTSAAQVVTVTNRSAVAVAIRSVHIDGDFAQSNTCGSSLAAASSCSVSVTFSPTVLGTQTGTLTIEPVSVTALRIPLVGIGGTATPTITSLSPTIAIVGSAGFTLTVTGNGFSAASVVRWNGTDRATTFISRTTLTATIPASDLGGINTAAVTVFSSGGGGISNLSPFAVYRLLSLPTNDILGDPASGQIYASIPGRVASAANSVTPIDPRSGILGTSIFVGSEPGKLAISDNSRRLYVALNGSASVRRVNLDTKTADIEFRLGSDPNRSVRFVQDMKVLPGNDGAIAVSRRYLTTTGGAGVAIYDDGIQRPDEVQFVDASALSFSDSATTLYGLDSSSAGTFYTMSVAPSGVSVSRTTRNLASYPLDFKHDRGRVFVTGGTIIDAVNHQVLGAFTSTNLSSTSSVVADPTHNKVFFLSQLDSPSLGDSTAVILAFDQTTMALVGTIRIPGFPSMNGTGRPTIGNLVRWGFDGLAFRDTSDRVFILQMPSTWLSGTPTVTLSPVSLAFPSQAVGTTSAAQTVTLENNSTAALSLTAVSASSEFFQTNSCGNSLAPGAACSISVTFSPATSGNRSGLLSILDSAGGHSLLLTGVGSNTATDPTIVSLSPTAAAISSSDMILTVTGTNFSSGSTVRWNGTARSTTYANGTTLTASIPASDLAALDTVSITVVSSGGAESNAIAYSVFRNLTLTTGDLVYDRVGRRFYSSIPASAPSSQPRNSILPIDASTGTLGDAVAIGTDPGKLAISDDGQYVYAALNRTSVRRFDIDSQTAGLEFALGSDFDGALTVSDMEVLPQNPGAVAIARRHLNSSGYGGVAVYDDGVKRTRETSTSATSIDVIEFSETSAILYGFDTTSTEAALRTMAVDSTGVAVTVTQPNALINTATDISYSSGRVYGTRGTVVDPGTQLLLGTFAGPSPFSPGAVLSDPDQNRVYFVTASGGTATIHAFDRTTYVLVGTLTLPGVGSTPAFTRSVSSLIRWGDHNLAFRTASGRVFFVEIPPSWLPNRPFRVSDRGGVTTASSGDSSIVATGYARITPNSGSTTPSGVAIFAYRPGSYLISETGVPATSPMTTGRLYAEVNGNINTGLAIANPGNQPATIAFTYTDASGNTAGSGTTALAAGAHISRFLNEPELKTFAGTVFEGTFSFTSTVPVSAMAIRSLINERGDFLMSTLPVIDTSAYVAAGVSVVPHFASGGGWTTQVLLVNSGNTPLSGSVEFRDDQGTLIGTASSYTIPARSSQKIEATATSTTIEVGSVRIVPSGSQSAPVAQVVFSFKPASVTVSQAGVSVISGFSFRMYAETSGTTESGNIQSGIAIANNGSTPVDVTFELFNLDGTTTGLPTPQPIRLPAFGHRGLFLADIFQGQQLPVPFRGILRITTGSISGISLVGLRTRYNELTDFLVTTTPATDELALAGSSELYFPQIADGGGYITQIILFSGTGGQESSGTLRFTSPNGQPLNLSLR